MNFWEEPHPWILMVCALFAATVALGVYPYPGWLLLTALACFAVGMLIVMRITHWWDFDE